MTLPTNYVDGDVLTAADVNAITTAVNAINVDAVKLVSINEQTTSYTIVLSDGFKSVEMDSASAVDLIVPPNSDTAFPIGTQLIVVQTGAGTVTLVEGSGVTINSRDSNKDLNGEWAGVTLIKRDTNDWLAVGDLTS